MFAGCFEELTNFLTFEPRKSLLSIKISCKPFLICWKRHNPPRSGIINVSVFLFILHYKYPNNLYQLQTSYLQRRKRGRGRFEYVIFSAYNLYLLFWKRNGKCSKLMFGMTTCICPKQGRGNLLSSSVSAISRSDVLITAY